MHRIVTSADAPAPTDGRRPPADVGPVPRLAWGVVAVCAVFGMLGSFVQSMGASADGSTGVGLPTTVVRYFSFFTILTNLFVAITATRFVLGRSPGPMLRVLLLNAVTGIVITGVVHWFLLRPISDIAPGVPTLIDTVQHVVVPVLAPIVWLVVGPRGHVHRGTVAGSLVFPLVYLSWTLIHGAATAWYPYPFIDVTEVGYGSALRMGALILVIMCLLAAGCRVFDRALARRALGGP